MRRALRRRWWSLSISAGLGLVLPASAQPPALPAPAVPRGAAATPVVDPRPRADAAAVAEDPGRLLEITVELAWLADAVTFPYPLAARVNGGTLEIRGLVSGPAVRERAVRIARQHCPLALLDNIKVQGVAAPRPALVSMGQLHGTVTGAIKGNFPQLAGGITVQSRTYGRVVLSGTVPTHEEKLAVSQCLRRLP